ncbi:hypothetical protein [uncultured Caulobacter sp.]|uniref:hypothetical protein n=1 Tax=uncultured Caulobacter sp. TaxID=158749 RepID=UPI00260A38F9|nr:hypothetical protein [uncultured Caulobacter sp.]
MIAAIGLALALALSPAPTSANVVVGDIGSRAFIVKAFGLDRMADDRQVLRGWLCRRAPGAPIRRLVITAEDRAGNAIWKDFVTTPTFAPGRAKECRLMRIDAPPGIASQVTLWRLTRP